MFLSGSLRLLCYRRKKYNPYEGAKDIIAASLENAAVDFVISDENMTYLKQITTL